MSRTFGVTTTSGAIGGIIANSITTNNSVETAEARDEKGKVVEIIAYSKSTELSINGLLDGSLAEPGTTITIGTDTYLVTGANKSENNTDFQKADISAKKADSATLTPLA